MRKSVAQIALEVCRENPIDGKPCNIGYGDMSLLGDIAERCIHTKIPDMHPLDKWQAILNALDRSPLFKKWHVRMTTGTGNCREIATRRFTPVEAL